jgi:hypothetical protein
MKRKLIDAPNGTGLAKNNDVEIENAEYLGKDPKGSLVVFIDSPQFFMDAYHFRPYDPELGFRYENGYIATWHSGEAVSVWTDGHVETMRAEKYQEQMLTGKKIYTK